MEGKAMSRHTKGEWSNGVFYCHIPGSAFAVSSLNTSDDGKRKEGQANARLISAAPDLLEFAKAQEAWEADVIINGDWSNEMPRLTQSQYDRMIELQAIRNAAISKAEGRAD